MLDLKTIGPWTQRSKGRLCLVETFSFTTLVEVFTAARVPAGLSPDEGAPARARLRASREPSWARVLFS